MMTLRILFLVASAMLFGLCVSCDDDDPVAPTPDPDNGEVQFVYHEVWQYDNEWGDTVTVYLNTIDSTYQCRVVHPKNGFELYFFDGEKGTLNVEILPYYHLNGNTGEYDSVGEFYTIYRYVTARFDVEVDPPQVDPFRVESFDGYNLQLDYAGGIEFYIYTDKYLFKKMQ